MDKKQKLINEIEAAKKEFYAKNPCKHCYSGNGCDDCRDCPYAEIKHQLSRRVYDLEQKFKQEYGEDYVEFKENERNKKECNKKENKVKTIDLTNLSSDELCKLSESINERLYELRKEEEIEKSQEFCKTLEVGSVYCEKKYNFYNDNTVYTIVKINGFEPSEKGRPFIQYTAYSITNKPDNYTNNLSIKCDEMNAPVETIKHMTIFSNRITKDAEAIISEIEGFYNRIITQINVANVEIFNRTRVLLNEHC